MALLCSPSGVCATELGSEALAVVSMATVTNSQNCLRLMKMFFPEFRFPIDSIIFSIRHSAKSWWVHHPKLPVLVPSLNLLS
jgi:hypothetical protein